MGNPYLAPQAATPPAPGGRYGQGIFRIERRAARWLTRHFLD